jgi:hypothetical protein
VKEEHFTRDQAKEYTRNPPTPEIATHLEQAFAKGAAKWEAHIRPSLLKIWDVFAHLLAVFFRTFAKQPVSNRLRPALGSKEPNPGRLIHCFSLYVFTYRVKGLRFLPGSSR